MDSYIAISAQLDALNRRMSAKQVRQGSNCDFCWGKHPNHECHTKNQAASILAANQANYDNNFNQYNNPYSNIYNQGWRNYPISHRIKEIK